MTHDFDFTYQGITFTMIYHPMGGIPPHWTDIEIDGEEADVEDVTGQTVASIVLDNFTENFKEEVRQKAFDYAVEDGLLNDYL